MLLLMFFVVSSLTPLVKPLHWSLMGTVTTKTVPGPVHCVLAVIQKKGVIKESLINFLLSPLVSLTQKNATLHILYFRSILILPQFKPGFCCAKGLS